MRELSNVEMARRNKKSNFILKKEIGNGSWGFCCRTQRTIGSSSGRGDDCTD
jgi:hypothetical protein